ncbi:sulfotransferase domain-containing protein [Cytophaga aurantiaca]|uniref:sulfotransferase domain-containing protein n=1 Tax=Cytophaga aurantiaca TaxID=29530 RepID=UPI00037D1072|nr:sulfotransferase domain-containing protein [Cytophaga aurantiaca]
MNIFSSTYLQIQLKVKIKQLLNILPFFKRNDYTKFLIVGHPRTGTSLMHTYLNSHWNILSLNEPLSKTTNNAEFFKRYSKIIKAVGFKYFYEYTEEIVKKGILIELFKSENIKVIRIERKNYLRTYVSRCIAEKTNEWSSTNTKEQSIDQKKIVLTKEDCLEAFAQYRKDEQETNTLVEEFNIPVFETDYETLVAEPNDTMFAIQRFLGVTQQIPQSLLVRQNAEPLNALIENYNVLKASFAGSEFEYFFDE